MNARKHKQTGFAIVAVAMIGGAMLVAACGGGSETSDDTPTSVASTQTRSASTATSEPGETATKPAPTNTVAVVASTSTPVPPPQAGQPTMPPSVPTVPSVAPTTAPQPPPPPPPPPTGVSITINGIGSVFSPSSGSTRVSAPTTITFNNQDVDVTHDFVLFNPSGGQIAATELAAGPNVQSITFTPAAPGSYSFKCSVHPQQMHGVISVQ